MTNPLHVSLTKELVSAPNLVMVRAKITLFYFLHLFNAGIIRSNTGNKIK
ncbi:predicted protein [Enterococcus gallinarum EG2]|nr:predicted protein [Enterococcus gallinarum EG2]